MAFDDSNSSFRDGAQHRTRNPEICTALVSGFRVRACARPGM